LDGSSQAAFSTVLRA
jgi:hypothetical protein